MEIDGANRVNRSVLHSRHVGPSRSTWLTGGFVSAGDLAAALGQVIVDGGITMQC
jgi:hypothetical protein